MMKKGKRIKVFFCLYLVWVIFNKQQKKKLYRILMRRLNGIEQDRTDFVQKVIRVFKPFQVRERLRLIFDGVTKGILMGLFHCIYSVYRLSSVFY